MPRWSPPRLRRAILIRGGKIPELSTERLLRQEHVGGILLGAESDSQAVQRNKAQIVEHLARLHGGVLTSEWGHRLPPAPANAGPSCSMGRSFLGRYVDSLGGNTFG